MSDTDQTQSSSPFDPPSGDANGAPSAYAIESRAETIRVTSAGDALRRGETNEVHAGEVDGFHDAVDGPERTTVAGLLRERSHDLQLSAVRSETTVGGRMSIRAGLEDSVILGGAMTDTWTGGTLIMAGMSDDLCVGAGLRITAPLDLWASGVMGIEEHPGTAQADVLVSDLCGALYEREWGVGVHVSGAAIFSGTICTTQRMGFRPLMKLSLGVRNLLPGGGGGAGGAAAPPAAAVATGAAAGGATLLVGAGAVAGGGAGVVRMGDNFVSLGRAAETAADLEAVGDLRRGANTASTLDDLAAGLDETAGARLADSDGTRLVASRPYPDFLNRNVTPPNTDLPNLPAQWRAHADELHDLGNPLKWSNQRTAREAERARALREVAKYLRDAADAIQAGQDPRNRLFEYAALLDGRKFIDGFDGSGEAAILVGAVNQYADAVGDFARMSVVGPADELADVAQTAEDALPGAMPPGAAPGPAAAPLPEGFKQADALESIDRAIGGRTARLERAQALADAASLEQITAELEYYRLAKAEFAAGRDPRVAIRLAIENAGTGSTAHDAATAVLRHLESPVYDFVGRVPDGLDTDYLASFWRFQSENLRGQVAKMAKDTPEQAERARVWNEVASRLYMATVGFRHSEDPRPKLLKYIEELEARGFQEMTPFLRRAVAEYTSLLADFRRTDELGYVSDATNALMFGSPKHKPGVYADPPPAHAFPDDPVSVDVSYQSGLDDVAPAGDEGRAGLNVDPGQVVDIRQGGDLDLDSVPPGALPDEVPVTPSVAPTMDGAGTAWRTSWASGDELRPLDEFGGAFDETATPLDDVAGGADGGVSRVDDAAPETAGDYETMAPPDGAASGDGAAPDGTITVSDDTQAVVDAIPGRQVPEDFDVLQTLDEIQQQYFEFRRASDWRPTIAYGNVVNRQRDALLDVFRRIGGDVDELSGGKDAHHRAVIRGIQDLIAQADQSGDAAEAARLRALFDSEAARTFDAYTDLIGRADEFEEARAASALDPHIDQQKLADWIQSKIEEASQKYLTVSGDAVGMQAVSDELAYFTQLAEAVGEGKNPVLDSSGQIAYLRSIAKTDQADAYLDLHGQLLAVLDDPTFHKSAAELGDATYAPGHFARLDAAAAPGVDDGLRTRALDPEVRNNGAGGPGEVAGGDYGANRDLMNGQLGDNDYARVPDDQPEGFENGRAGGGADASDGTSLADPDVPTEADLDQSIREATPNGGEPDANAALNGQLDSAQSPPGGRERPYKEVRFGDARILEVLADGEDVRLRGEQWDRAVGDPVGWRRPNWEVAAPLLIEGGDAPWWEGGGLLNRAAAPLDPDAAIRHVPTPEEYRRNGQLSTWRAGRQPGFGRVHTPGAPRFSDREVILTRLMQGVPLDARHIELLLDASDVANTTARTREGTRLALLVNDLEIASLYGRFSPQTVAQVIADPANQSAMSKLLRLVDAATAAA